MESTPSLSDAVPCSVVPSFFVTRTWSPNSACCTISHGMVSRPRWEDSSTSPDDEDGRSSPTMREPSVRLTEVGCVIAGGGPWADAPEGITQLVKSIRRRTVRAAMARLVLRIQFSCEPPMMRACRRLLSQRNESGASLSWPALPWLTKSLIKICNLIRPITLSRRCHHIRPVDYYGCQLDYYRRILSDIGISTEKSPVRVVIFTRIASFQSYVPRT